MSEDDQAFQAAILDKRGDDAPRLIYADWLEELGRDKEGKDQRDIVAARNMKSLESWRTVWRGGFAKTLPLGGLGALREALETDDKALVQGSTTMPMFLTTTMSFPIDGADAITFCGWKSKELGIETIGEAEEFFARHCFECDTLFKEAAVCRYFLNWWDDTPRPEVFRELWIETILAIERR